MVSSGSSVLAARVPQNFFPTDPRRLTLKRKVSPPPPPPPVANKFRRLRDALTSFRVTRERGAPHQTQGPECRGCTSASARLAHAHARARRAGRGLRNAELPAAGLEQESETAPNLVMPVSFSRAVGFRSTRYVIAQYVRCYTTLALASPLSRSLL